MHADILRSIGTDEREENAVNDLFDLPRRQGLLHDYELIPRKVERQRSQARSYLVSRDFSASNPAAQNFRHYFEGAFMHFRKKRWLPLAKELCRQAEDNFRPYFVHHF